CAVRANLVSDASFGVGPDVALKGLPFPTCVLNLLTRETHWQKAFQSLNLGQGRPEFIDSPVHLVFQPPPRLQRFLQAFQIATKVHLGLDLAAESAKRLQLIRT